VKFAILSVSGEALPALLRGEGFSGRTASEWQIFFPVRAFRGAGRFGQSAEWRKAPKTGDIFKKSRCL